MNVLCLCRGGLVRSAALAAQIRYATPHDAIAYGLAKAHGKTLEHLIRWANRVVLLDTSEKYVRLLDEILGRGRYAVCNIGDDIWQNPLNPHLQKVIIAFLASWIDANYAPDFVWEWWKHTDTLT